MSREEEVVMPDYTGASARCCICGTKFQDILHCLLHVHKDHQVLGGPQNPMLGQSGELRAGYHSHISSFRR